MVSLSNYASADCDQTMLVIPGENTRAQRAFEGRGSRSLSRITASFLTTLSEETRPPRSPSLTRVQVHSHSPGMTKFGCIKRAPID